MEILYIYGPDSGWSPHVVVPTARAHRGYYVVCDICVWWSRIQRTDVRCTCAFQIRGRRVSRTHNFGTAMLGRRQWSMGASKSPQMPQVRRPKTRDNYWWMGWTSDAVVCTQSLHNTGWSCVRRTGLIIDTRSLCRAIKHDQIACISMETDVMECACACESDSGIWVCC